MKKYHQPSGLPNGLDFLIDSKWTPEQAYAVFQLLDDLRDRILAKYELSIVELIQEERTGKIEPLQVDNPYPWDDDNPF
jgi:hypothetical protein